MCQLFVVLRVLKTDIKDFPERECCHNLGKPIQMFLKILHYLHLYG